MNIKDNRPDIIQRIFAYLAKFSIFVAVPGLHLFLSGKRALGAFLSSVTLAIAIAFIFVSYEPSRQYFLFGIYSGTIFLLAWMMSVGFVASNLKKLNKIRLGVRSILFVVVSISVLYWPQEERDGQHLEFSYNLCPAICFGDITAYDNKIGRSGFPDGITRGMVIVYEKDDFSYANRVFAEPGQLLCFDQNYIPKIMIKEDRVCHSKIFLEKNEYYVRGDNKNIPDDSPIPFSEVVQFSEILAVDPTVVGNWAKFYEMSILLVVKTLSLFDKYFPSRT